MIEKISYERRAYEYVDDIEHYLNIYLKINEKHSSVTKRLTLYGPDYLFRRFSGHNLR